MITMSYGHYKEPCYHMEGEVKYTGLIKIILHLPRVGSFVNHRGVQADHHRFPDKSNHRERLKHLIVIRITRIHRIHHTSIITQNQRKAFILKNHTLKS